MRAALILACMALSACAPKVITRDTVQAVKVPVSAPCALAHPEKPAPIVYDDSMDARQKAAAVGAKAIEWRDYGEALDAATGACK